MFFVAVVVLAGHLVVVLVVLVVLVLLVLFVLSSLLTIPGAIHD